jgi:hypothetical protein
MPVWGYLHPGPGYLIVSLKMQWSLLAAGFAGADIQTTDYLKVPIIWTGSPYAEVGAIPASACIAARSARYQLCADCCRYRSSSAPMLFPTVRFLLAASADYFRIAS